MQVLKVKYGEDTRRVTLQSIPSFADLTSLLEKLFNINGFTVKYEDEDKDLITVSTDLELKEAFAVAAKQPNGILRLFLFGGRNSNGETVKDGKQENTQTPPPNASGNNNTNSNPNPFNFIQQILQNLSQQATPSQVPDVEKLNEMFNSFGFNASNNQSQQPQVNWQQLQGLFGQLLQNPMIRDMIPSLLSTFSQFGNHMQDPLNNMWNNFNSNDNSNVNSNDTSKDDGSEDTTIHYGVLCDSCEQTISGIRYKCTVCADYDLCEECKNKLHVHNPTHPFQTITKPIHHGNGSGRGCPYGRYNWPPNRWNNRNSRQERNSNTPKHQYLARFVSDVNLPDGTSMGPNNSFVKIWKLRNEGSQAWPEGTRLEHVGGDKISPVDFIAVQNVNPGEEIDLAVDMISPSKPGRYVTYWRLSQPDGSRFGQRVWADILVIADKPVETNNSTNNNITTQSSTSMEVETPVVVPPVVPSAPPVVPSAPPVTPDYPPKVTQLLEMGFSDPDLIITYLKKNNDDIMRTVQDLLNHSK